MTLHDGECAETVSVGNGQGGSRGGMDRARRPGGGEDATRPRLNTEERAVAATQRESALREQLRKLLVSNTVGHAYSRGTIFATFFGKPAVHHRPGEGSLFNS